LLYCCQTLVRKLVQKHTEMKVRSLTYRHQNMGQNHILYVAITYLESTEKVRVFEKSNRPKSHCIHWEIKSRFKLRNSDSNLEGLEQRSACSNLLLAAIFRVQTPLGARDFFSPHTFRPTLGRVPERGDVALINHYHLAPTSRMSRFLYSLSVPACMVWDTFTFIRL
jgi:hypothetical protein